MAPRLPQLPRSSPHVITCEVLAEQFWSKVLSGGYGTIDEAVRALLRGVLKRVHKDNGRDGVHALLKGLLKDTLKSIAARPQDVHTVFGLAAELAVAAEQLRQYGAATGGEGDDLGLVVVEELRKRLYRIVTGDSFVNWTDVRRHALDCCFICMINEREARLRSEAARLQCQAAMMAGSAAAFLDSFGAPGGAAGGLESRGGGGGAGGGGDGGGREPQRRHRSITQFVTNHMSRSGLAGPDVSSWEAVWRSVMEGTLGGKAMPLLQSLLVDLYITRAPGNRVETTAAAEAGAASSHAGSYAGSCAGSMAACSTPSRAYGPASVGHGPHVAGSLAPAGETFGTEGLWPRPEASVAAGSDGAGSCLGPLPFGPGGHNGCGSVHSSVHGSARSAGRHSSCSGSSTEGRRSLDVPRSPLQEAVASEAAPAPAAAPGPGPAASPAAAPPVATAAFAPPGRHAIGRPYGRIVSVANSDAFIPYGDDDFDAIRRDFMTPLVPGPQAAHAAPPGAALARGCPGALLVANSSFTPSDAACFAPFGTDDGWSDDEDDVAGGASDRGGGGAARRAASSKIKLLPSFAHYEALALEGQDAAAAAAAAADGAPGGAPGDVAAAAQCAGVGAGPGVAPEADQGNSAAGAALAAAMFGAGGALRSLGAGGAAGAAGAAGVLGTAGASAASSFLGLNPSLAPGGDSQPGAMATPPPSPTCRVPAGKPPRSPQPMPHQETYPTIWPARAAV